MKHQIMLEWWPYKEQESPLDKVHKKLNITGLKEGNMSYLEGREGVTCSEVWVGLWVKETRLWIQGWLAWLLVVSELALLPEKMITLDGAVQMEQDCAGIFEGTTLEEVELVFGIPEGARIYRSSDYSWGLAGPPKAGTRESKSPTLELLPVGVHWGLLYNMVIIANNRVSYTWKSPGRALLLLPLLLLCWGLPQGLPHASQMPTIELHAQLWQ